MQVAGTTEVDARQDITHMSKKDAASVAYTVHAGQTEGKSQNETYQPSKEGLSMLASENLAKYREAQTALENLKKQEGKNPYEDYTRAMRIALNMMRGKRVPPKDEKFLMEFDDKLYQAAKYVQMMKELKEDAESELEDEDENDVTEKIRKLALDGPGAEQINGSAAGASSSDIAAPDSSGDAGGGFSATV